MMPCLYHVNAKPTMMTWCSGNANTNDICHLIPMWHEWNANTDDIMITWFTLYANSSDVMLGMHDAHAHAWHMCSK